ncbi:hypothetical protein [Trebonia sp.]|uniref:hypothetical protein n=1 Tax=Trebonia sp. TaxID=2767075 RepID=UPI002630C9BC|nr:hypothetical protein [Trebonia sp.]
MAAAICCSAYATPAGVVLVGVALGVVVVVTEDDELDELDEHAATASVVAASIATAVMVLTAALDAGRVPDISL